MTEIDSDCQFHPVFLLGIVCPDNYHFQSLTFIRFSGDWSLYRPKTNALWLDYLIDKLFNGIEGNRPRFPKKQRNEAVKKFAFTKDCSSASDFVRKCCSTFTAFYDSAINEVSN
uniref:Non-specific serine/threonine protein kinase n=1 Tax=Panagrellus redivivus TaxID=6233 RepID=A0A7E4V3A3_PANRE